MESSGDSDNSSSSSSSDTLLVRKQRIQMGVIKPQPLKINPDHLNSIAPIDCVCETCERSLVGQQFINCSGPCLRSFHIKCVGLPENNASNLDQWKCKECVAHRHVCYVCKQWQCKPELDKHEENSASDDTNLGSDDDRMVRNCRALSCGKYYHIKCVRKLPLTRLISSTQFICPIHTCATCEMAGKSTLAVRCVRCPMAYHTQCVPKSGIKRIMEKRLICLSHFQSIKIKEEKIYAASISNSKSPRSLNETNAIVEELNATPNISRDDHHHAVDSDTFRLKLISSASNEGDLLTTANNNFDDDDESVDPIVSHSMVVNKKQLKKDKKKKKKKRKKDRKLREKSGSGHLSDDFNDAQDHQNETITNIKSLTEQTIETEQSDLIKTEPPEVTSISTTISIHSTVSKVDSNNAPPSVLAKSASISNFTTSVLANKNTNENTHEVSSASSVKFEREEEFQNTDPSSAPKDSVHNAVIIDNCMKTFHPLVVVKSPEEATPQLNVTPSVVVVDTVQASSSNSQEVNENDNESPTNDVDAKQADPSRMKQKKKKKKRSSRSIAHTNDKNEADDQIAKKPRSHESSKHHSYMKVVEDDDEADEAKWVQCDSCRKWRTVLQEIDLDTLPEKWYCKMNYWDHNYAFCDVSEEVIDEVKKPLKVKKHSNSGVNPAQLPTASSIQTTMPTSGSFTNLSAMNNETVMKGSSTASQPSLESSNVSATDAHQASKKDHVPLVNNINPKLPPSNKTSLKKNKLKSKIKEKYREVKWVQCESVDCGKWRVVPSNIDVNMLPSTWYCHLNTWAPELANCKAENPLEVATFLLKKSNSTSNNQRPNKRVKVVNSNQQHSNNSNATNANANGPHSANSASSPKVSITNQALVNSSTNGKHSKQQHKQSSNTKHIADQSNSISAQKQHENTSKSLVDAFKGRKVKKTVLEWAQCEKCNKWRKLPHHVKSSTLPDKWYCSMNHWDTKLASCSVPEEVDPDPLEGNSGHNANGGSQSWYTTGYSGNSRNKRGKLSFRELLYGSSGHLRKTYTEESSTLSFEYEDKVFHRDDQYRKSSYYHDASVARKPARNDNCIGHLAEDSGFYTPFVPINSGTCVEFPNNEAAQYISASSLGWLQSQAQVKQSTGGRVINDHDKRQLEMMILNQFYKNEKKSIQELVIILHSEYRNGGINNNISYGSNTTSTADSSPPLLISHDLVVEIVQDLKQRGLLEKLMINRDECLYQKCVAKPLMVSKPWKHGVLNYKDW